MARALPDWIDGFMEYSALVHSPAIFRKWAAIGAISGALQRRVFVTMRGEVIFGNMYILLVAPPGVGKTNAIKKVVGLVRKIKSSDYGIAPDSTTREKLFEEMEMRFLQSAKKNKMAGESSLTAFLDEFGVFCKRADVDFMAALSKAYDCPDIFEYKTKHHGENHIENIFLTIVAGCTPTWIKLGFPPDVFEIGFPARLIMLHSDEKIEGGDMFDVVSHGPELHNKLVTDLKAITRMKGELKYDPAAKTFLRDWIKTGMAPVQTDPRLEHYNTRRILHINKVGMVLAASAGETSITVGVLERARETLLEAEVTMARALEHAGENPLKVQMSRAVLFIGNLHRSNPKRMIKEYKLRQLLQEEVHPQLISVIINELIASRYLKATGDAPNRMLRPSGKTTPPEIGEQHTVATDSNSLLDKMGDGT